MAICKSVKTRLIKTTKKMLNSFVNYLPVEAPAAGAETLP